MNAFIGQKRKGNHRFSVVQFLQRTAQRVQISDETRRIVDNLQSDGFDGDFGEKDTFLWVGRRQNVSRAEVTPQTVQFFAGHLVIHGTVSRVGRSDVTPELRVQRIRREIRRGSGVLVDGDLVAVIEVRLSSTTTVVEAVGSDGLVLAFNSRVGILLLRQYPIS